MEKQNVMRWFTRLDALQAAAATFNTNIPGLTPLLFANTGITTAIPTPDKQAGFIARVAASPGIMVSVADLNTTFMGLLNSVSSLNILIGAYLQTLAAGSFPDLTAFLATPVSTAFPGGSGGAAWVTAANGLASAIPSICFSRTLQDAVAQKVNNPGSTVNDLASLIAGLG